MDGLKRCSKCGIEKCVSEFNKDISSKDGYRSHCKACMKDYREVNKENKREWYEANKESIKEKSKEYREANKEIIKEKSKEYYEANKDSIRGYKKDYYEANKESINKKKNEYIKAKRKTDPLYKMGRNIGHSIYKSLRKNGYSKKSRTHEILGCSYDEFRNHIESQFGEGMTWDNMGEWHLDHKIPVSYGLTEEELRALNHYSNFQPLWGDDNIKKGNRWMD